jgi:hypothetical protein
MKNFELIDDYLANRLSEADKTSFEGELQMNTELQREVAVQHIVIEGVKKARAAELKAMLNNVPVGGSINLEWPSSLKIAAGVVGAGLLIAGLSYYFNGKENLNPASLSTSIEDSIKQPNQQTDQPSQEPQPEVQTLPNEPKNEEKKSETPSKKEEPKMAEPARPKIEVLEPTEELAENARAEKDNGTASNNRSQVSVSHIAVETDATNKRYSFHYQFTQGKLHLYGDFDKGLYEIVEVNGDSHAVFLYYKELYYLLDEKQVAITKLEPIKDKTLISKLKEYRGR